MNIVRIDGTIQSIEKVTGCQVYNVKLQSGYIVDCVECDECSSFQKGDNVSIDGELATYDQGFALVKIARISKL